MIFRTALLAVLVALVLVTPAAGQGAATYFKDKSFLMSTRKVQKGEHMSLSVAIRQDRTALEAELQARQNQLAALQACLAERQRAIFAAYRNLVVAYNCLFGGLPARLFNLLVRLCRALPARRAQLRVAQSRCAGLNGVAALNCRFTVVRPAAILYEQSLFSCRYLALILLRRRSCGYGGARERYFAAVRRNCAAEVSGGLSTAALQADIARIQAAIDALPTASVTPIAVLLAGRR